MKARAALNSAFNICLRAGCDKLPPHAAAGITRGCSRRVDKRREYIPLRE